ncbi:MAG: penicillin-binding protein 2 [bacterium]
MRKFSMNEIIKTTYKAYPRVTALVWVTALLFLSIVGRLFYLQIIKGKEFAAQAQSNSITPVRILAPRGYIYDRNFKSIVVNTNSKTLSIIPKYFFSNKNIERAQIQLAGITGMDIDELKEKIYTEKPEAFEPIVVKRSLTDREMSVLTEKKMSIDGLLVEQEPKREYPYDNLGCHILGYVGEINREQLKNSKYEKYKMGDMLGLSGLESFYDTELRGEDGMVYILTDSRGKQKEVRGRLEPKAGSDVVLTIDFRLQKYAEHLMERYKYNGVIISIVPKTGEILCMTSKPDYNLNYFSGKINAKEWKRLLRDKYNPLSNRVTQGIYSPGSIFKIAVGSGGLNERIVDVNDAFFCDGLYWIKTWPYKCWRPTGHGWVSFYKAVEQSCDIYFYKLGLKMKIELLYKYAKVFGLGEKTGIDLAGEKKGLVPSREWKSNVQKSTWFPGNTVMMSIGQGYLTANPLQVLNLVEAIANGGYTMQPHLMKAITMPGRKIIRLNTPKKLFDVSLDKGVMKTMQTALQLVVNSPSGTAKKAAISGYAVAGKTSSVENPNGETHAIFCGYAPYDNPEIITLVLIEHGGGGGDVAAPIAKEVMEYYFKTIKPKGEKR